MRPIRRLVQVFALAALIVPLLSGCGAHLYNAENDKRATQTKEKFAAADVTGIIKTARENNARMTMATLEAFRRGDLSLRDEKLWGLALGDPTLNQVVDEIVERQKSLLGGERKDFATKGAELDGDVANLAAERSAVTSDIQVTRIAFGFGPPSCESFAKSDAAKFKTDFINRATAVKPPTGPDPEKIIGDYQTHCQRLLKRQNSLIGHLAGALGGGAAASWKREQNELARLHDEAARLKKVVDEAAETYKKAAEALAKSRQSPDLQGKAKDALDKLGEAFDALAAGADAIGKRIASEERLKYIHEALEALTGIADASKDEDKSLETLSALAGLPHLADEAIAILRNRQTPHVTPLLIEKERQQYLLKVAQQAEARMERRVALWQQLAYAMIDEALANDRILTHLCSALSGVGETDTCDPDVTIAPKTQIALTEAIKKTGKLANPAKKDTSEHLWTALADYGHLYYAERPAQRQLQVQLAAIYYESALDESETALKLWQALIAAPIDQLVAYHGTGIKPEDVANLAVQAIGLGSIGVGVNK